MLRTRWIRILTVLAAVLVWLATAAPAWAAPGSLGGEVLLVVPNRSGVLPAELQPLKAGLAAQGYTGARVADRRAVRLEVGRPAHVEVGTKAVDLDLQWVRDGRASVRVVPEGARPAVVEVRVDAARFFVTVPAR